MDESNVSKKLGDAEQRVKASLDANVQRFGMAAPGQSSARTALAMWVVVAIGLVLLFVVYVFGVHFSETYSKDPATRQLVDLLKLLVANWTIVVFVGTLLVAAYVQIGFGFDYFFETFRNASTSRDLSKFYGGMGDRMMAIGEWKAAEEAYNSALKINPYNAAATYGVAKARVFNPVDGEKISTEEVIDVRLQQLFKYFPKDSQIHFLKGLRSEGRKDYVEAKTCYDQSIKLNPGFMGPHLGLGDIAMAQSDPGAAQAPYAKAVEVDSHSAVARNNLGACLMRLGKFTEATEQFEKSYNISATALIATALGAAYWFSLNFKTALVFHQYAANYLNESPDLQDRFTRGGWRAGFLPLRAGDLETGKRSVEVYDGDQKKAIVHFQLAIDHALLGEYEEANKEFDIAMKLQPSREIRQFTQNSIQAIENWLKQLPKQTTDWLAEHGKSLD